jgi:hypothetical protein
MLTLIVIPAAWMLQEDATRLWRRLTGRLPQLSAGHAANADNTGDMPVGHEKPATPAPQAPAYSLSLEG